MIQVLALQTHQIKENHEEKLLKNILKISRTNNHFTYITIPLQTTPNIHSTILILYISVIYQSHLK